MKKIFSVCLVTVLCSLLWACTPKNGGQADQAEDLPEGSSSADTVSEFAAVDLEGNTVTNEIFSQADLTVVNFWGTYCTPCINEMPELAEWSESMPDHVQIIGVIVDAGSEASEEYAAAQEIAEKTGVKYPNLAVEEGLDDLMSEIVGVPTTFFIDKDGNIVGEPVLGADVDGYKQIVEEYING